METKNNRKRPHKKNFSRFRAKAKRYSQNGRFGRGTHIEDDDFRYFLNILESMKDGFEDVQEKEIMAANVLEQTKEREIHLSSNQIVCKVFEALLAFANDITFERYLNVFGEDLRVLCSDAFASHVLQKLLEVAFLRACGKEALKTEDATDANKTVKEDKIDMLDERTYNLESEFKVEHRQKCSAFVERVGKFLLNNMEDFVWDACANYVMRTALLSLAGIHITKYNITKVAFSNNNAEAIKNRKLFVVAPQWHEIMKEYAQRLQMWPQFKDMPYEEQTSALLGVVCTALHQVDKRALKHFGKKLLNEAFLQVDVDEDDKKETKIEINGEDNENDNENDEQTTTNNAAINLPKVFNHQSSVMLLETLLTLAGPKVFTQLYAMLFAGRIEKLALEQSTNFAVQKLLNNLREKQDFEHIFDDLGPHVESLLKKGNTGLVSSITAACLRLSSKQAAVITALQRALHVAGDQERMKSFLHCLIKLKPYEIAQEDNTTFVHLHGSLMVQHILNFNKPILLVNCILETSADKLCAVFNTPNGSHIVNAFLESKFVGEKSREKLIRHLENFYVDLAVTKFGSRCIDCLFAAAQENQKMRIVKALSEKGNLMASTPFGRLLDSKLMLRTYRLSPAQWKASYFKQNSEKVRDLFKDIVT